MSQQKFAQTIELELTSEQAAVVFDTSCEPAVIVAGAGSGKTAVMAARMVASLARLQADRNVLGLTFTRKAASELKSRVRKYRRSAIDAKLLSSDVAEPEVSTYHSFAQNFVREHGLRAGIDADLRIATEFELLPISVRVAATTSLLDGVPQLGNLFDVAQQLRRLDAELAEHCVTPAQLARHEDDRLRQMLREAEGGKKAPKDVQQVRIAAQQRQALAGVVTQYRLAKADQGVMDYADMMRLADDIAHAVPNIAQLMQQQYQMVLLDEYQDTSVVQRNLLVALFGGGHEVVAVGDPKQSIYGFRGAAQDTMSGFCTYFSYGNKKPREYGLSSNFRSGANIVAVANRCQAAVAETPMSVGTNFDDQIFVNLFASQGDEDQYLISTISDRLTAGISAGDIMVLCEDNATVNRLALRLQQAGIAAVSSSLQGVLQLPVVCDVLAYMRLAADPAANDQLLRILASPRWAIGLRDMAQIRRVAQQLDQQTAVDTRNMSDLHKATAQTDPIDNVSLLDALHDGSLTDVSLEGRQRLSELAKMVERFAARLTDPLVDQLNRIVRDTGIGVEALLGDQAELNHAALGAILDLASSWQSATPGRGTVEFLNLLKMAQQGDSSPDFEPPVPTTAVRVMTIHKSKGLQAKILFIPGMDDCSYDKVRLHSHWTNSAGTLPEDKRGDLPTSGIFTAAAQSQVDNLRDVTKQRLLSEKQRLIYVALTRAEQELHVSAHRAAPGRKQLLNPCDQLLRMYEYTSATGASANIDTDTGTDTGNGAGTGNGTGTGVDSSPGTTAVELYTPQVQLGQWCDQDDLPLMDAEMQAPMAFPMVDGELHNQRLAQAALVEQEIARLQKSSVPPDDRTAAKLDAPPQLSESEATVVEQWQRDVSALLQEATERATARPEVLLPQTLSVSQLQQLLNSPEEFALQLRRPMPRPPSRAAARGTQFHAWYERRWHQQALLDVTEFAADAEFTDNTDIERFITVFEQSEYAILRPKYVEYPVSWMLGTHTIIGRIDAVFQTDTGWKIVDWKTNAASSADALQLAAYRLAFAQDHNIDPAQVEAAFFYVSRGQEELLTNLPDKESLEQQFRSLLQQGN